MKIILIAFVFISTLLHPFYLGMVDIRYKTQERSLQCSVRLFTNDLENALSRLNQRRVDLINYRDTAAVELLLKDYLKKRFSLTLNGTTRAFELIGFEREEEATWMHLEFSNCETPRKIEIQNALLYDFLRTQANIVHADVNGVKKSSKAENPRKEFVFDF